MCLFVAPAVFHNIFLLLLKHLKTTGFVTAEHCESNKIAMQLFLLSLLIVFSVTAHSFQLHARSKLFAVRPSAALFATPEEPITTAAASNAAMEGINNAPQEEIVETAEEKYIREKKAEIAERKAAEVFVTRNTGRYECQACGYMYDVKKGMESKGIMPGTPWDDIEKIRCPQCGANKKYFVAESETLSGFQENLKYGIGTNQLTGGQKSNLIFGGLFLGFLMFMSGYLLE